MVRTSVAPPPPPRPWPGALSPGALAALMVYRHHKNCTCHDCEVARLALAEWDRQSWPGGG